MKYTKRKKNRIKRKTSFFFFFYEKRKTSYENKNCRFMYISRFIEF